MLNFKSLPILPVFDRCIQLLLFVTNKDTFSVPVIKLTGTFCFQYRIRILCFGSDSLTYCSESLVDGAFLLCFGDLSILCVYLSSLAEYFSMYICQKTSLLKK